MILCGGRQIYFANWKFIVLLYNATLESINLFCQSDVLLISPNIFLAIFSAYTVGQKFGEFYQVAKHFAIQLLLSVL